MPNCKRGQPCLGLRYEPRIVNEAKPSRVEKRKESFDFLSSCRGIKAKAKVKPGLVYWNFATLPFILFLLVSSYCCFVSFPSVFQQNQIPKKKKQNPTSSPFLVTLRQIISFSLLFFLISLLFSNKTKFQKKKKTHMFSFFGPSLHSVPLCHIFIHFQFLSFFVFLPSRSAL